LNQVRLKKRYKNFEVSIDKLFECAFNDIYVEGMKKYSDFMESDNLGDKYLSIQKIKETGLKFFPPTQKFKLHPLYAKIHSVYTTFQNKELLNNLKNSDIIKNLDDAMSVYLFASWNFNNDIENILNLKIAFIFREYLNFIGWENLEIMAEYQIIKSSEIRYGEDFTKTTLGSYLPELLDDFIGIYLKNGCTDFDSNFSEVKEFVSELCNMLYNEELISYMIEPQEE
jgi:hypothetical protein